MKNSYDESELIHNRASLLLYGGTLAERRAWAEEARTSFAEEGPLVEVTATSQLTAALARKNGVVFVPDVLVLGTDAQASIMRCLQHQEERPKLVLGLMRSAKAALEDGQLRTDLHYRLHKAQLDLGSEHVQAGIKARRSRSARSAPGKSRPSVSRSTAATAVRRPRAVAKVKPSGRSRR